MDLVPLMIFSLAETHRSRVLKNLNFPEILILERKIIIYIFEYLRYN